MKVWGKERCCTSIDLDEEEEIQFENWLLLLLLSAVAGGEEEEEEDGVFRGTPKPPQPEAVPLLQHL